MIRKLPDRVIEVILKALENDDLIQKQARLCDLAALDAIPSEILPYLKLHHQKAIALSLKISEQTSTPNDCVHSNNSIDNSPSQTYSYLLIDSVAQKFSTFKPQARINIANNPKTHPNILVELSNDPYKELSYGNAIYHVQIGVASNPNTPIEILELLYEIKDIYIRQALAKNPNIPINLIRQLAGTKRKDGSSISINLASNINTPLDILKKIADENDINVKLSLLKNTNTPLHIIEKISHCKARHVKEKAVNRLHSIDKEKAANPETSIEELQKMLNHQDVEVRQAVKLHTQGLNLLLDRCLKPERHFPEQNSLHRVLTGMYLEISTEQIDNLFHSKHWLDRLAVVCNPKISREYLTQLTEDENTVIRETARELLLEK